jgi:hypothetical protein
VGKLGLSEKIPEINGKFNQYILNLNADDYVGYKNTEGYSLVYILGMSRIIWAMKQVNYTDGLIWLERLERRAVNHSKEFETSKTWASSALEYLKSLLGRKNIKLHSDN